jgi:hypothetical protein
VERGKALGQCGCPRDNSEVRFEVSKCRGVVGNEFSACMEDVGSSCGEAGRQERGRGVVYDDVVGGGDCRL